MSKLKLMTIIGTRPEIIRLSATIKCCDQYFDQILCLLYTSIINLFIFLLFCDYFAIFNAVNQRFKYDRSARYNYNKTGDVYKRQPDIHYTLDDLEKKSKDYILILGIPELDGKKL